MTTGVASFLVTLTLLAGVAFLHHRTSSPASESSAGGRVQRSAWSDGLDVHHRDADLPQRMRGVSDERAHYMDTITPADDDDTAWFSACITVPPPRHDDKIILTEGGVATPAASLTPAQRAVAAREQATARALRQKREAIARQGRPLPGSPFQRDADGKTKRVHPQQPPANDDTNPWLDPTNPFSFKRKPKRNPSEACIYSPEYRAEHPDLCSKVNKTPGVNTGTLQGPFRGVAFDIVPGKDMACAAWGWFSNDLNSTGWNYLYIESNPTLDDEAQARAAGWLEGALTIQPIWEHRTNEFQNLFTNGIIASTTKAFLNDMTLYNLEMVATNGQTDPYWTQMGLIYQQLQGIWEGYTYQQTDPTAAITYFQILCLQYDGDMSDIQIAAGVNTPPSVTDPLQKIMDYLIRTGHCSALIKLLDGNADLFAAHDTWAGFSSMHRMFKAYVLPFSQVASTRVQFSSYPAFLASTDDWYQTYETQLTVLETTNDIVNLNNSTNSLYNLVTSSSVGAWARAIVATRLATGGQEWTTFFSVANSGTYNNQWMVVDYALFTPGAASLTPNTLWIIETLPGSFHNQDVTAILESQRHWASYNRPFFTPVYAAMGYQALNQTYGEDNPTNPTLGPYLFGYSRYFRALLFDREQKNISSLYDMQRVMSLNKWQTDPLSRNNSGFAISSRFDLSNYDPVPVLGFFYHGAWGAYDVKITMSDWNQGVHAAVNNTMRVSTHSGPTSWDQVPFSWLNPQWINYASHVGLPSVWDFPFLQFHL